MPRQFRLGVLCLAAFWTSGCATRCTLTPIDTPSRQLDAWVSWDSSAAPRYTIVARLPWDDLRRRARAARTPTCRIILNANVVDACGDALAGNTWSRQEDVTGGAAGEVYEQRVRLRTAPGEQRLTLALLVQGADFGPLWQRTFDVPALDKGGLALEPPQFMRTAVADAGNASEPVPNASRYYDESTGAPLVRSAVHDFAPATDARYALRVRVRDVGDDRIVFEAEHEVQRSGSVTSLEVELPVQGLGRHVLELRLKDGTRIATSQASFDIGFADLAEWGSVEAGREILLLLFSSEEIATLDAAATSERAAAWERLWQSRDPDPTTPTNEFKDAVARRIQYATVQFSEERPGWQTDRGRVYVAWGEPEQVDVFGNPDAFERTERWTYAGGETVFVFVDARGSGEYVLKRTNASEFLERMRRQP